MKKKVKPCQPQQLPPYKRVPSSIICSTNGAHSKERRIATEALVSIASGVGIKCLIAEVAGDKTLL